jgi:hypothetical protein
MAAETSEDIASSVQLGLVLPRATRATSIFMALSIHRGEAGPGRLSRSWRVLRNRSVALPTSFAGGAPAGSAGHPVNRRRGALSGTSSMRSPRLSSTRLRRPSFALRRPHSVAGNSRRSGKFPVFPDPRRRSEETGRLRMRSRTCRPAALQALASASPCGGEKSGRGLRGREVLDGNI